MFCCDCLFIFPHSFCSSVNKLDGNYFSSVVISSAFVKPYSFMTFVNVGNSITGVRTALINFTVSSRWLKFASTWVMLNYLNSMNWTLSLLSVGDCNTFKLSSAPVKLLLWCWIYCLLLPLFFRFCLLIWRRLSPFPWLSSLPTFFTLHDNFHLVWASDCFGVSLLVSMGFIFPYWPPSCPNTF